MYDLVYNQTAINIHLDSHKYYASDPDLHDGETKDSLREQMVEDINLALNHFASLTIVSLCTTFELAAKEFLYCFFLHNPTHVHDYVGSEDSRGQISLKEVLKVNSYQALLSEIAKKSASKASKGNYGQVLSKIANLCNERVESDILYRLDSLQKERHKIVHEKYKKTWELKHVQNAEVLVSQVIELICKFGLSNNIPGKYTCVSNEYKFLVKSAAFLTTEKSNKRVN